MRTRLDILRDILDAEQRILDRIAKVECEDAVDRQSVAVLRAELDVADEMRKRTPVNQAYVPARDQRIREAETKP